MNVDVLHGAEGARALDSSAMRAQWASLHAACEWSTVFQSVAFATTWYRVYTPAYDPFIVVGRESDGTIAGLLLLARDRQTGALVHVGEKHAEYQTWISRADRPEFVTLALDAAKAAAPGAALSLRYVPPTVPLDGLLHSASWASRVVTWVEECGLADLNAADGIVSLIENSRYRYRMRRLAALGPVSFRVVRSRTELEPWLAQIIATCDVRQGAINASFPFHDDPLKRELHLAMLDQPELLHVTLLTAGDTFISAQINFRNKRTISLGLISHSPIFGKISPGTLHLLLLARLARDEGFEAIDLTPGGDYKDRFASRTEATRVVNIQFSAGRALRAQARDLMARTAKAQIRHLGLEPAAVKKQVVAKLTSAKEMLVRAPAVIRGSPNGSHDAGELRMYRLPPHSVAAVEPRPGALRVDEVGDLILPDRAGTSLIERRPSLRTALTRFERGERLLTDVQDGVVAQSAWLAKGPSRVNLVADGGEYGLGDQSVLIYAFAPSTEREDTPISFLQAATALTESQYPNTAVYVVIESSDATRARQLSALNATLEWERPVQDIHVAQPEQAADVPQR